MSFLKFNRNGNLSSRAKALASAASALIEDDSSGGNTADDGTGTAPKGDQQTADGVQTDQGADKPKEGDDAGGEAEGGEPGGPGTGGDGSSDQGGAAPVEQQPAGDQPSEAALAAGRAQMHERIGKVFAHENCAGREAVAAELLTADLPADKIIATLGKLPKGNAGVDMLNRLAGEASSAPALQPGGGTEPSAKAEGSKVWDKVHTSLGYAGKK